MTMAPCIAGDPDRLVEHITSAPCFITGWTDGTYFYSADKSRRWLWAEIDRAWAETDNAHGEDAPVAA